MKTVLFCFVLIWLVAFPAYSQTNKPTSQKNKPKSTQPKQDNEKKYYDSGVAKIKTAKTLEVVLEALEDFNRAIELKPNYADAYYQRGYARIVSETPEYAEMNSLSHTSGDFRDSIADFTKAIQLKTKFFAQAFYHRGTTKTFLKDTLGSIEDLDRAIQLKLPADLLPLAYYQRGVSKRYLRNYREAVQDFNIVIRLKPNDFAAYVERGTAKYYLNDVSACDDWRKGCSLGNRVGCNNVAQFCGSR